MVHVGVDLHKRISQIAARYRTWLSPSSEAESLS